MLRSQNGGERVPGDQPDAECFKQGQGGRSKTAPWEDPELTTSHKQTESTAAHWRNPNCLSDSLHIRWTRKKTPRQQGGEAEHNLPVNCTSGTTTHTQEGTQNPSCSLWWRVWTPPFMLYLPHSRVLTSAGKELVIFVTATQMAFPGHQALARGIYTCGLYIFIYFESCCLKVWPLTSLNLGADWAPLWDTDRCWQTLNSWEPLKISCLNNHRGLRNNRELGQGWTIRFFLTRDHSLKTVRGDCFMRGNKHRKSRKIKKQRKMSQTEQDKNLKKGPEWKVIYLLKDSKSSFMIIKWINKLGRRIDEHCENFNKEMENIGKYQILSHRNEEFNTWTKTDTRGSRRQDHWTQKTKQWNSPKQSSIFSRTRLKKLCYTI